MKDKLITYEEFSRLLTEGRSLGTISPVRNISGPSTTLFYDLRGLATYTSCASLAMGTLDRWRIDPEDELPLNRDQYVFYSTGTPSLVRIVEREKNLIPFHWSDSLPYSKIGEYPKWAENMVNGKIDELERR